MRKDALRSSFVFASIVHLVCACGIAGLPNFAKKERFHDVPSDPIVKEGAADTPEEAKGDDPVAQEQQQMASTCQAAGASQRTAVSGLFNSFPSVSIEKDALVEISTLQAIVTATVSKPVNAVCFTNSGLNNNVTIDVIQPTGYLDIDATIGGSWRVNVSAGAAIKDLKVRVPTTGSAMVTVSGPGTYPCPDVPGVTCL